jgi:hypothetical protein
MALFPTVNTSIKKKMPYPLYVLVLTQTVACEEKAHINGVEYYYNHER